MTLNPRQRAFANAYAKHGVAERAAIDAGYSRTTARAQAARLLANVGIREYLGSLTKATESRTVATLAELREIWTSVVRGEAPGNPAWKDRLRASEMLAKSMGGFLDRHEVAMRPISITMNLGGEGHSDEAS